MTTSPPAPLAVVASALTAAPACTVADVAKIAGYGNATALANAFAMEGLPLPRKIGALLKRD